MMRKYNFKPSNTVILLLVSLLMLSGCGFKPRGSGYGAVAGQQVFLLSDNPYGALERSLKEKLTAFAIATDKVQAENGIRIKHVNFQKRTLSVDADGRPAEYETMIIVNVSFHLKSAELPQQKQFSVQRDYVYDKNNTLSHDRELEMITSEMYDDLGQRIVAQFLQLLTTP